MSTTSIFSYLARQLGDKIEQPRYRQSEPQNTFARSMERAAKLGGAMVGFGLIRRDTVALVMPNTEDFIVSLLAVIGIGAIAVPIPALASEDDLAEILQRCGAKLIVTTDADISNIIRATARTQNLAAIVSTSSDWFEGVAGFDQFLEMSRPADLIAAGADALLVYQRDSGGAWESVMLDHSAFVAKVLAIAPSIYDSAVRR